MPPSFHSFATATRVLRLGGPPPGQADPVLDLITASGLTLQPLPESPPATPEAFRGLTRQARFALIDLDCAPASLAWLKALRERCPVLPVAGIYTRADLPALLAAGSVGLDGAIKLPASAVKLAPLFAPWLPPPSSGSPTPPADSGDTVLYPRREKPLAATHLSPASDANQALLHTIDAHPDSTRFVATGPVGAEFSLVARELAARRKIPFSYIALPGLPAPERTGLLVTDNLAAFTRSTAPFALFLRPGAVTRKNTRSSEDLVNLSLKPLQSRLPDIAHYLRRWLPEIFTANHREDSPFPFSPAWRHAFLAHSWPGEFSELIRAMHRFALLPADQPPPPGFLAPLPRQPGFDSIASTQIPLSYRARLSSRIPPERLPAVLSALGCPPPPSDHE